MIISSTSLSSSLSSGVAYSNSRWLVFLYLGDDPVLSGDEALVRRLGPMGDEGGAFATRREMTVRFGKDFT